MGIKFGLFFFFFFSWKGAQKYSQNPKSKVLSLEASWTSLVTQTVKRLPTVQETWVQSLGWEDPLEKEMETHSSILAWKIPWMEDPVRLQSTGSQRVGHD